jgi:indolepyruvate ferredoxin oxidoreductase alpha subunit
VEIRGKDLLGLYGELDTDRVLDALSRFLGIRVGQPPNRPAGIEIPRRPPILCPGCPHRATYFIIRKAVNMCRVDAVYPGDIGCYTLGVNPPFKMMDSCLSMGASIGVACGLAKFQDRLVIAFIGDSTFYHAGIPGLINAVYNQSPLILVVMDNEVTAMTGNQPNPATGYTAMGERVGRIPIEDIARAVGIEMTAVIDPYRIGESVETVAKVIRYVLENRRPAVIVSRRICSLEHVRNIRARGGRIIPYVVDEDKCTACKVCTTLFACPAIYITDGGKAAVDEALCVGCGVCVEICPFRAFKPGGGGGD